MSIASLKGPAMGWLVAKGVQIFVEESLPPLRRSEKLAIANNQPYVPQGQDRPSRYRGILWQWRQWIRFEYETRLDWMKRDAIYLWFGSNIDTITFLFIYYYDDLFKKQTQLHIKIELLMAIFQFPFSIRHCVQWIGRNPLANNLPEPIKSMILRVIKLIEPPLSTFEDQPEIKGKYPQGIINRLSMMAYPENTYSGFWQDFWQDRNKPVVIDRKSYIPYKLPASLQDESLNYSSVPDAFHTVEFFDNHRCSLSDMPVMRPLFIITDKKSPRMYERNALVKHIFEARVRGIQLLDPITQEPFTEQNLFHCPDLTEKFSDILVNLFLEQPCAIDRK